MEVQGPAVTCEQSQATSWRTPLNLGGNLYSFGSGLGGREEMATSLGKITAAFHAAGQAFSLPLGKLWF